MIDYRTNLLINLEELKLKFFYFLFSLLITFLVSFNYKEELLFLVSLPFLNFNKFFIYTGLLDPIFIYLKLSISFSFFLTFPIFVYFISFFFFRSFSNNLCLYLFSYLIFFYLFTWIIFIFIYFVLFPYIFYFLISFERSDNYDVLPLLLNATLTQYYTFFYYFIYCFLIMFYFLNIIFIFLCYTNKINLYNFTVKVRKYIYTFWLFIFLVIAPPDFFIQLLLIPIFMVIIELWIWMLTIWLNIYLNLNSK